MRTRSTERVPEGDRADIAAGGHVRPDIWHVEGWVSWGAEALRHRNVTASGTYRDALEGVQVPRPNGAHLELHSGAHKAQGKRDQWT